MSKLGYELKHPSLRNCVVTVPLGHLPFGTAQAACPVCGFAHRHKTLHLTLDDAGRVIVSPRVFTRLVESGSVDGAPDTAVTNRPDALLEYVGAVEPPDLGIGFNGSRPGVRVVDSDGKDVTPTGRRVLRIHDDYT